MHSDDLIVRWEKFLTKLHVTLLPYQAKLAAELLQFPDTAKVTQCRQSGKSFVLGLLSYFFQYVLKWDVVITAPKEWQTWHIMRHVHRAQDRIRATVEYDNRYSISLKGRGSVTCLSGSETANVEGSSAHLVIVDEHQDLRSEHVAEIFIPMLSWYNGLYWSCGIGGDAGSVAERDNVDFEWSVPWQEVVEVKPDYQRLVNLARKEMLPEQFAAHYECKPLDMSAKRLVTNIQAMNGATYDRATTIVGIDWGKRLDQSIVTVVDHVGDKAFITNWLAPTGTYDSQIKEMTAWLKDEIEYDQIISESNGVGDSSTDVLVAAMHERGVPTGIIPMDATQGWKTEQAKKIHRMTADGTLKYNAKHDLSGPFLKDIKSVDYKMLDSDHVKCTHSDFLSSLMCALHEQGSAYL